MVSKKKIRNSEKLRKLEALRQRLLSKTKRIFHPNT